MFVYMIVYFSGLLGNDDASMWCDRCGTLSFQYMVHKLWIFKAFLIKAA